MTTSLFSQDLKIVTDKKGKSGYANQQGEIVIKCKYDVAFNFRNGVAKVGKDKKLGFINTEGKEVLPIACSEIEEFEHGVAKFTKGKKSGLINEKAEVILEAKYDFISPFNFAGKAWVNIGGKINSPQNVAYAGEGCVVGGKFGVISISGKVLVEPKYTVLMEFSEQSNDWKSYPTPKKHIRIAINTFFDYWGNVPSAVGYKPSDTLRTDCKYMAYSSNIENWGDGAGLLDGNGNILIKETTYIKIGKPINGLLRFYALKGKEVTQGYWDVNSKKEITIQKTKVKKLEKTNVWSYLPDSLFVGEFCTDIAPVYQGINDGGYFINSKGEKISENMRVMRNSSKGENGIWFTKAQDGTAMAYDHKGNIIVDKGEYQDLGFNNPDEDSHLMPARKNGLWGLINTQREVKIPFEYRTLGTPNFSRVIVQDDRTGDYGFLKTDGTPVTPCMFSNVYLLSEPEQNYIWVQKSSQASNDSLWYNYNIQTKEMGEKGYTWVSRFYKDYCLAIPNDLEQYNTNAPLPYYGESIKKEDRQTLGLLVDKKGNIVFPTPIPNNFSVLDVVIDYVNRAGTREITRNEQKRLILQLTKSQRVFPITETISEKEWDF